MEATTAEILWFEDKKGYGFARTTDGTQLFVHRNNFVYRADANQCLVEGSKINCQIKKEVDDFERQLNEGRFRDDASINPRHPRSKGDRRKSCPRAVKIRVVRPEEQSCGS